MQIVITKSAKKDLQVLDKKQRDKIISAIFSLENFPDVKQVKKLVNFFPQFRLRVGDYRVLFENQESVIRIARVVLRKNAYK